MDPLEDLMCNQQPGVLAALAAAREAVGTADPRLTDFVLLRFLKVNKLDVDAAVRQVRGRLQWEAEHDLDGVVSAGVTPDMAKLQECYPHGWHGVDRFGRPVLIERIGLLDTRHLGRPEMWHLAQRKFMLDSELLIREKFPACSLAAGCLVHRSLNIIDLGGLSFRTASDPQCRALVKQILTSSKNYYPEVMGKTVIVNAPRIFSVTWSAIKPSLDSSVVDRIEIVGQDPEKVRSRLLELVEPDQLPTFLGGRSQCSLGCGGEGPWSDPAVLARLRGGPSHFEVIQRFAEAGRDGSGSGAEGPATSAAPTAAAGAPRAALPTASEGDGDAVASLRAALMQAEAAHMKTLEDWILQARRFEAELGTRKIIRASPVYEAEHFLDRARRELAEADVHLQNVVSDHEDALLAAQAAKSTLETLLKVKRETELPELPEDVYDVASSKLTAAVDCVAGLELTRAAAGEERARLAEAAAAAEMEVEKNRLDHRLCILRRCSVELCRPYFEAKRRHECSVEAEVDRLVALRSRLAEEAGRRGVCLREATLCLGDFELAGCDVVIDDDDAQSVSSGSAVGTPCASSPEGGKMLLEHPHVGDVVV